MLQGPVKHVRGWAETCTSTWADLGRAETFSMSPSGIVDRQRPAAADYRFRPENSQDSARWFLRCCRLARKLLAAITSPT
jgi:hypothetical protein